MDADEIVPISRGKLRRFMYENYAEGVAAQTQALLAKLRYHICFDHLEKGNCDHSACWELIRIMQDIDPMHEQNRQIDPTVGQALDLYSDPNLVWSVDLEKIRQPLVDLMRKCAESGSAPHKLRLLAQAMLPEIAEGSISGVE